MSDLPEQLTQAVAEVASRYHRLALLVGPPGSGKTQAILALAEAESYPYLSVSLDLSQRMLEIPKARRARRVSSLFMEAVSQADGAVVLLDNTEILFHPSLRIDPLRMLQSASRNQTIVATWPGQYVDGELTAAEPDHPEYVSYREVDAAVIPMAADR